MFFARVANVLFVATAFAPFCAGADSIYDQMVGTAKVAFVPMESRGNLIGCTMLFSAAIKDTAYEQGALVSVKGNVTLMAAGDGNARRYIPSIKLGVFGLESVPIKNTSPPEFIYVTGSKGSTATSILDSAHSDEPGMRIAAMKFDGPVSGLFADVASGGAVTFAYSRGASGLDSKVPVDFRVVDTNVVDGRVVRTRNDSESSAFAACTSKLLATAK